MERTARGKLDEQGERPPFEAQVPQPVPAQQLASFSSPEAQRAWARLVNAVARGALTGLCLKGGLNLVGLLLAVISRRSRAKRSRSLLLSEAIADTRRYTTFLGAFVGVIVAVDEGLAALFGKQRTARWRALVAGLAAGPTLLLTGRKQRHTSLALYVLLRGITLLIRCGNTSESHPLLRRLLTPTRWKHGDTALMCLATSQIGYSWIVLPQTLPPGYVRFLNQHGGKQDCHYGAVRELMRRNKQGLPPGRLKSLDGCSSQAAAATSRRPCTFLHKGQGCNTHLLSFLPQAYLRALPVYLPVYVLPAILVHRAKLVDPERAPELWRRIFLGAARSSGFLALYCTLAWRGACAGFQLTGTSTSFGIAASCWTGGLATLVEKKSRRMELAIYCMSRCVESFCLCLREWGWVSDRMVPPRLDILMFMAACGAIMHCYSDAHGKYRSMFRSKYLNVLDFILGSKGFEEGSLKHVPSTSDLLNQLDNRLASKPFHWRQRASSFAQHLSSLDEPDSPDSTRSSFSAPLVRPAAPSLELARAESLKEGQRPPLHQSAQINPSPLSRSD
ncbi:hypothetical protein WJX74_000943 [Apatococcus lobatus]|uniref:Transmembrane protein 135 N-terminal domain-containing protein n=1 Tax=Apatococcus lobatus TaxID=904363 RepID=A0AAW1QHY7_9CHLO